jgi:Asp-tRNA(Asn)/Glu-tRNA(Gln) amidotransferase A subunit family amidase
MAYETNNEVAGRTSNPWDLQRSAGGSSGGEAAAIAAGCSALGIGSDGGGSIRVPAHFCGIAGLKPTPGRIPGTGHFPPCVGPFAQLGVVGPMARSVRDLQLSLAVLAGYDAGDPTSAPVATPSHNSRSAEPIRMGLVLDGRATAEIEVTVERAAAALRESGLEVEAFAPNEFERAERLWFNIFCHAGAMAVRAFAGDRISELSPMPRGFLEFVEAQRPLTTEELLFTLFERDELRARLLAKMQRYSVLLTPVSSIPAFRHGEGGWGANVPANYLETMRYTQWFNLLGMPAVTVPVTRSSEGLPIGVQIAGRPWEEETILEVAAKVEDRFGYTVPPLAETTLTISTI